MPTAGQELARFTLPVDVSKAREMALSLGAAGWDTSPEQLSSHQVVPSFTSAGGLWHSRQALLRDLGIDMGRVLHGEQRWFYRRMPRVGEVLDAVTRLGEVVEREGRRGGSMRFYTLRTDFTAREGALVLTEEMVVIETLGAPSPAAPKQMVRAPDPESIPIAEPRRTGPVTRSDFVRYAGASGDFNPIHHDEPYAVRQGFPSVFGMGMYHGGMLAVFIADALGEHCLEELRLRFRDQLWPGEALEFTGCWEEHGGSCLAEARTTEGRLLVTARARVTKSS